MAALTGAHARDGLEYLDENIPRGLILVNE